METTARFPVRDYDLAATLTSGQAFRWKHDGDAWQAVIHGRWVCLRQRESTIEATTAVPVPDWRWLRDYLRLTDDHAAALASFPDDAPLRAAVAHCPGLRLLRQERWECLASFILSSTKQIVQIQQCITRLCERFGERVDSAPPHPTFGPPRPSGWGENSPSQGARFEPLNRRSGRESALTSRGNQRERTPVRCYEVQGEGVTGFAFPSPARLAAASEAELRACKIGFRARYLHAAARLVDSRQLDLARVQALPLDEARAELMRCPGVGRKIADCVLLFAGGFDAAFPIDVWVERALRQLYFSKRRVKRARLERFAATHFGPHAGLAQQYLFHYLRTGGEKS